MNQNYTEMTRWLRPTGLLVTFLVLSAPALWAQSPQNGRTAHAARSELEAMAAEAERAAAAAGDARVREQRRAEAAALRERLVEGDFQVGDRIALTYPSGDTLNLRRTDTLRVRAGRVVDVPHVGEVPLRGVLRSELQDHMTRQVARFFREPDVKATALIRVAVFGAVGHPGFYDVPADSRVSDAIMLAGGPAERANLDRTAIRRNAQVLLGPKTVQNAIRSGQTLDQLHLRAGDEIVVGEKKEARWQRIASVLGVVSGLAFTISWLIN